MSEPDVARSETFNGNESLAALDFHAAQAWKRGDYGCHADLMAVIELIDTMAERRDELEAKVRELENELAVAMSTNMQMLADMGEVRRQIKAGIESLS